MDPIYIEVLLNGGFPLAEIGIIQRVSGLQNTYMLKLLQVQCNNLLYLQRADQHNGSLDRLWEGLREADTYKLDRNFYILIYKKNLYISSNSVKFWHRKVTIFPGNMCYSQHT